MTGKACTENCLQWPNTLFSFELHKYLVLRNIRFYIVWCRIGEYFMSESNSLLVAGSPKTKPQPWEHCPGSAWTLPASELWPFPCLGDEWRAVLHVQPEPPHVLSQVPEANQHLPLSTALPEDAAITAQHLQALCSPKTHRSVQITTLTPTFPSSLLCF